MLPALTAAVMFIILPDNGSKYVSKMFNDAWMREKGFLQ
jgi:hypothetical protein